MTLPKVALRPLEPADLDLVYTLEVDLYHGGSALTSAPPSRQLISSYISSYSADIHAERQLRLVVCNEQGKAVGIVDLSDYDPHNAHAFVGIAILGAWRHKGFGTAALLALDAYAATIAIHSLLAQVADDNAASRALFVRAGYRSCGCLRSWLRRGRTFADALLFQKLFP